MPRYEPTIHRSAKRELEQIDADARERLTDTIAAVARERKPSSHEKVRQLEGPQGLLRVRVGDYRAVLELESPELRVLRVGHRSEVYDALDDGLTERRASA